MLGRAGARPGHRRPARRDRPVDHLGPHPPDRPGHRPGAGPADRDRDAALGDAPRRCRTPTARPGSSSACSATPRPRSTASRLLLNRRQTEILAILALHPDGLSLDRLHALVYGDQAVTLSTLKAEVSHLRAALGGQLASRPYRLTLPVATDIDDVLDALRRGDAAAAIACYGGDLLPGTESPALVELGEYVAVAMREALLANPDPHAVIRYSELAPYDAEVLEVCLAALGDRPHPAKPLLKGRLAVAGG